MPLASPCIGDGIQAGLLKETLAVPFFGCVGLDTCLCFSSLAISLGGCSERGRVSMNHLEWHLHHWGVSIFLSHSHWTDRHTEARDVTFSYLHCLRGSWTLERVSLPQLALCVGRKTCMVGHQAPGLACTLAICGVYNSRQAEIRAY